MHLREKWDCNFLLTHDFLHNQHKAQVAEKFVKVFYRYSYGLSESTVQLKTLQFESHPGTLSHLKSTATMMGIYAQKKIRIWSLVASEQSA